VVTVLRPDYPLVRFGTGDLSGWMVGPDGLPRLRGVLGRTGAAVKVKGMFLHPRQVAGVMAGAPGVADYRFVIGRVDHVDTLRCEVLPEAGAGAGSGPAAGPGAGSGAGAGRDHDAARDGLVREVGARVRDGLRFRADVVLVESLTPGDGPMVDTRDWS